MWPFDYKRKREEKRQKDQVLTIATLTSRLNGIVEPLLMRNPDGSFLERDGYMRRSGGHWPSEIEESIIPNPSILRYVNWTVLWEFPFTPGGPRESSDYISLFYVLEPRSTQAFRVGIIDPTTYEPMDMETALRKFEEELRNAYREIRR